MQLSKQEISVYMYVMHVCSRKHVNVNMPDMPGIPGMPGMPGMPDLPSLPGMPNMPGMPHMSPMPHLLGMPGMRDMPGMAGMPGMPSMQLETRNICPYVCHACMFPQIRNRHRNPYKHNQQKTTGPCSGLILPVQEHTGQEITTQPNRHQQNPRKEWSLFRTNSPYSGA